MALLSLLPPDSMAYMFLLGHHSFLFAFFVQLNTTFQADTTLVLKQLPDTDISSMLYEFSSTSAFIDEVDNYDITFLYSYNFGHIFHINSCQLANYFRTLDSDTCPYDSNLSKHLYYILIGDIYIFNLCWGPTNYVFLLCSSIS